MNKLNAMGRLLDESKFPPGDFPKKLTKKMASGLKKWVARKRHDSLASRLLDLKWEQYLRADLSGYLFDTTGRSIVDTNNWVKSLSKKELLVFRNRFLDTTGKSYWKPKGT